MAVSPAEDGRVTARFEMGSCAATFEGPEAFVQEQVERIRELFRRRVIEDGDDGDGTDAEEPAEVDESIRAAVGEMRGRKPKRKWQRVLTLAALVHRHRDDGRGVSFDELLAGLRLLGEEWRRKALKSQVNLMRYKRDLLVTARRGAVAPTEEGEEVVDELLAPSDS